MDQSVTPWRPLIQSGHWVWIVRSLRKRWESAEPLSTEGLLVVISRQETEGLGEEAVTFRKVVTPWLPFKRPGLRVAP